MPKKTDVEARMESARDLAGGTMDMWVIFDTEEEVTEALAWKKGKHKVSTIEPITKEEAERRHQRRYKEIAAHYGISS